MKEQHKIPTGKVERALKLIGTGAKIGGNYLKYYSKKTVGIDGTENLHQDNAEDIYNSLSKLKGSALKVTQMLSMDRNFLPRAYTEKFAMSQYSAPPMSAPLVIKTIEQSFNKKISDIFTEFDAKSFAAASIGQVHKAKAYEKDLAVKIQYPGVRESIKSDLALVKPMARAMFGLPQSELDTFFLEVEEKLLEETDYNMELQNAERIKSKAAHLENLLFPSYYPELSSHKVLTMDWMYGMHLKEFLQTAPSQKIKNKIAQTLWDFYGFLLHDVRELHADPHPGNFLFHEDGRVGVIDFGCMKKIPDEFYYNYFPLILDKKERDVASVRSMLHKLDLIFPEDDESIQQELTEAFLEMASLLNRPFSCNKFHFTNDYLDEIYALGETMLQINEIKKPSRSRGSKHALYINRAFFGLYTIVADLNAEIEIKKENWFSGK